MMKKQLLKITMALLFLVSFVTQAQVYNFTAGDQGWVKGYGTGTVAHDPTGGVASDGALTLERLGNGNANIRRGQGGDDAFVVLNRATVNYIKIRYKNDTKADAFRVQGTSRPAGTSGVGTDFSAINYSIVSLNTEFVTAYIPVSTIPAGHEVTRLDILVRGNQTLDASGSKCIFDEIEFISDPYTYSEFIINPSFDDVEGSAAGINHFSGGGDASAVRSLSTVEKHDGTHSLLVSYPSANSVATLWTFSSYSKTYDTDKLVNSTVQVKMWVKTNRAATIKMSARINLFLDGVAHSAKPISNIETTNTAMGWEELTFDMTVTENAFDNVALWFAINYNDADPANLLMGDTIYIDQMTATIMDPVLATGTVNASKVNVYPNPAQDNVTVAAAKGSAVAIYNLAGAQVLATTTASETQTISIANLTAGVYIVKVVSEGKTYNSKLVVK
jgi:hypothetical protein